MLWCWDAASQPACPHSCHRRCTTSRRRPARAHLQAAAPLASSFVRGDEHREGDCVGAHAAGGHGVKGLCRLGPHAACMCGREGGGETGTGWGWDDGATDAGSQPGGGGHADAAGRSGRSCPALLQVHQGTAAQRGPPCAQAPMRPLKVTTLGRHPSRRISSNSCALSGGGVEGGWRGSTGSGSRQASNAGCGQLRGSTSSVQAAPACAHTPPRPSSTRQHAPAARCRSARRARQRKRGIRT